MGKLSVCLNISKQAMRKVIVFIADFCIFCAVAMFHALFSWEMQVSWESITMYFMALYGCMAFFQILFRTYESLWRYAAHQEYFTLLLGAICGAASYDLIHYALGWAEMETSLIWGVVSLSALGMLAMRFLYRMFREQKKTIGVGKTASKPVAIVGAGLAGMLLLREFQNNPGCGYRPVCFFDDEPEKHKRRIGGIPVMGKLEAIPKALKTMGVKDIIIAMPSVSSERISEVLQICQQVHGADIRVLPTTLANVPQTNQSLSKKLRKVEIGDLLGRKQIDLENETVQTFLAGKVILVTGGGGSIGSELCRQIAAARPKKLVILDIYENSIYDIQQELIRTYGHALDLCIEIASIREENRINDLFAHYRPQVVFHAAAHKHVPLMEHNPQEAVRNNVFGTFHVAMAAHRYGVEKFVQVSTDKAVNPTNVMGATKRMCELVIQGVQAQSNTEFAAVRFGNVLGSNGSVIPLFRRQISNGGPVTLTDKRIIRYFMTIPEAVQLVLQAGAMAEKNQVFVLDMGKPTRILDLAENLIRLSGLEPYKDIDIQEIGLRPGEKLYEELLVGGRVIHTENDLIFVEEQPDITKEEVDAKLAILQGALASRDDATVVNALRSVVPTFYTPEMVNAKAEMAG